MNISLSHCHITVHDFDQALSFYRDAMGLDVKSDVKSEYGRWVTLTPPAQPEIEIVLSDPHSGRSQEDGDAMLALLLKGEMPGVIFRTKDLDTTFEKVAATGAEVLQEPMDQFWGVRDCAFRDPSGNMVRVNQA